MTSIPGGPLGRPEMQDISRALAERLRRAVSIEVWTRTEPEIVSADRDAGEHAPETLALMRQLKTLHSALTLTPYDLDKHAARAAEAGISVSPTVVLRSGGRSVHLSGMFYGPLFPPVLDIIGFLSMGRSPLAAETQQVLHTLEGDVEVEAFLTPFDPFSVQMLPLLGAMAAETRQVRLRLVEIAQFPVLAGQRLVTEVPLLVINGKRFAGYWNETDLARQIALVAQGSDEKVIRDRVLVAEYVSEADARRFMAEQQAEAARAQAQQLGGAPPPGQTASGLYVPGRD